MPVNDEALDADIVVGGDGCWRDAGMKTCLSDCDVVSSVLLLFI